MAGDPIKDTDFDREFHFSFLGFTWRRNLYEANIVEWSAIRMISNGIYITLQQCSWRSLDVTSGLELAPVHVTLGLEIYVILQLMVHVIFWQKR